MVFLCVISMLASAGLALWPRRRAAAEVQAQPRDAHGIYPAWPALVSTLLLCLSLLASMALALALWWGHQEGNLPSTRFQTALVWALLSSLFALVACLRQGAPWRTAP